MGRAEGKAAIDYAFHMIVRELTDQVSSDMDAMVRQEGITSFKLFMAYPGVFMVDDATIFRPCCGRATTAASSACMPRTAVSSTRW